MDYFFLLVLAAIAWIAYKKISKDTKINETLKKINKPPLPSKLINVNPNDHPAKQKAIEKWGKDLKILKKGRGEKIEFTYDSFKKGKERRQISLEAILTSENGNTYLYGTCLNKQEKRTFDINKISTMLLIKGKRYDVVTYLMDEYDI